MVIENEGKNSKTVMILSYCKQNLLTNKIVTLANIKGKDVNIVYGNIIHCKW